MGDAFGLFVLIQPSGGKLWRFKYRFEGREKKLAIGTYPVIGLAEARQPESLAHQHRCPQRVPDFAFEGAVGSYTHYRY